ncbi:MAG: archease [Candidatus Micrarchaeota archaeon]
MGLPRSYKFIDEITYADVAFEANGISLEELFTACGEATIRTMVENPESIAKKKKVSVKIESDTLEKLLYNFLDKILFYKDADSLVFKSFEIRIVEKGNKKSLSVIMKGEKIDIKKHHTLVDVKAVSYHNFKLEKTKEGIWKAFVILDV